MPHSKAHTFALQSRVFGPQSTLYFSLLESSFTWFNIYLTTYTLTQCVNFFEFMLH